MNWEFVKGERIIYAIRESRNEPESGQEKEQNRCSHHRRSALKAARCLGYMDELGKRTRAVECAAQMSVLSLLE